MPKLSGYDGLALVTSSGLAARLDRGRLPITQLHTDTQAMDTHARVCAAVRPEVMHADDDGVAYFQTSGFALKLRCAVDEAIHWMKFQCEGPALPHVAAETAFNGRQVQRARAAVARSLGAHPDEIMLNECCAVGINYVAMGLDWRPGDVVVLTEHEHPSNRIPWYGVAERWGVTLCVLGQQPGADQTNEALLAELAAVLAEHGDRVRLLSASHVSRRTGARLPIAEMCALINRTVPTARTLIDGAQAFGAIEVDVKALGCDFYVTNGHKYCLAPTGTGAMYVSRAALEGNYLKTSFVGSHSQLSMGMKGELELLPTALAKLSGRRTVEEFLNSH